MCIARWCFALALCATLTSPAAAQRPGEVTGRVIESDSTPVESADVSLVGVSKATATDADGRFRLIRVEPGAYQLRVSRLGYRTVIVPLSVHSGESVPVSVRLTRAAVEVGAVVVTATREDAARAEIAANIGVVDSTAIANTRPHHSSEIVNRIPGALVIDLGGEGHTMALRLPINYAPVYAYLEDGIPIRSTGFFNHNALYEINVPAAARIEVFKGPASALYGSDAIGGVVNVLTTAPPATPTAQLFAEGGQFGYGRGLFSAGRTWASGAQGVHADLNITHFDGWRDNAHQDRQSATVRWDARLAEGRQLKTVVAFSNIDSPGDGGSEVTQADFDSRPETNYTPIAFRKVKALRWSTVFQSHGPQTLVELTAYARYNSLGILPSWQLTYDPQVWDTHNYSVGMLAKYRRSFVPWRTSVIVGADADLSPGARVEDEILPTQTGNVFTSYTVGARQYDYRVTFRGVSPYAQVEASPLPRLRVSAGLRLDVVGYDYDNKLSVVDTGSHRRPARTSVRYDHLSPKLGLTYEFSDALNAFASYRHGFRVPSEDQLFVQGSAQNTVGLQPVRANSFEAGLRARVGPRLSVEASTYSMDVSDDILTFFDTLTFTSATSNAGRTRHWGVEIGADAALTNALRLGVAYAYARNRYVQWVTATGVDYSGHDQESAPRHIANTRVTYSPRRGGAVAAEWAHVGGYYTDPDNAHRYDGYDVLNLFADVPVSRLFSLMARLNNVTSARYATTASFNPFVAPAEQARYGPGTPRSLFVGVQYGWRQP
ncbi:MAG TPA: TonB-dependent receptor [Gemmatimonadales bacterium]|nr:TonB-dependent receptor [Gemmatimonadales bacterium]